MLNASLYHVVLRKQIRRMYTHITYCYIHTYIHEDMPCHERPCHGNMPRHAMPYITYIQTYVCWTRPVANWGWACAAFAKDGEFATQLLGVHVFQVLPASSPGVLFQYSFTAWVCDSIASTYLYNLESLRLWTRQPATSSWKPEHDHACTFLNPPFTPFSLVRSARKQALCLAPSYIGKRTCYA